MFVFWGLTAAHACTGFRFGLQAQARLSYCNQEFGVNYILGYFNVLRNYLAKLAHGNAFVLPTKVIFVPTHGCHRHHFSKLLFL